MERVQPTTVKNYMFRLQMVFNVYFDYDIKLLPGKILKNKKLGIFTVIDNLLML